MRRKFQELLAEMPDGLPLVKGWDTMPARGKEIALGCEHVTPAGANIFLDLGFGLEEAAKLKAESYRIIAVKLAGSTK